MSKHENGRPPQEAATQHASSSVPDLDAVVQSLPPRIDPAGMDLRELEAATERRFRAVKRAVTAIYERATARFRCEPPATPPAWAAHPERLSSEAMEQIVLTEQRAHANGYYAGFVDAVRLIWRLARALGYAEGQRKLARDLAAANRAFLTEHARALAAAVDPTPRESTMERAARNRARLRKAGVIA